MLRSLKLLFLRMANALGVSSLLMNTTWRKKRLLILCYHGISTDDQHRWNSDLYMPPDLFRKRLLALQERRCNVLPLGEALERLYAGTLPPRAVTITFDDGMHDFHQAAYPLLREFGYPATVYLTTYYSDFNRPVFDVMCSYLLWKGRGRRLEWPEITGEAITLDDAGRGAADRSIKAFGRRQNLSGRQKDELLATLASKLAIDYEALCDKRILHVMTPGEAAEMARQGVVIELHTHRHRVSTDREKFEREIIDNRTRIAAVSSGEARHFCYPGGFHLPEFPGWLRELNVTSATTCQPGIASRGSDPMLLSRLVDTSGLTELEFYSWLSGLASLLPHRPHVMSEGQLMEEPVDAG
ncbi:MAG TPA: polysaccharide deacetylase family protein [Bryobacteraceae bacterium]|jgi:peptidoglycan/xylan/chitin deacetylase (PgdA/CDA1 family)|nr:polysaccharide deacetylase family protein [Bryobacteraceae bacterium]